MKFKKGDKILDTYYIDGNSKRDFKKSLSYDLIIGVVDKRYYAVEDWSRTSARSKKYTIRESSLIPIKDYEDDFKANEEDDNVRLIRNSK